MKPQYYALDWEVSTASSVYLAFNGADALYSPTIRLPNPLWNPMWPCANAYLNMRKNRLQRMTFSSNTQD